MLYKFRNWNDTHHKKIITSREVFFSSMKWFNDPFDSNIRVNYKDLSKQEHIEIITDHVDQEYSNLREKEKQNKIKEYLDKAAFDDPEKLKENYEEEVKQIRQEEFGLLSLAGNKESIVMWSHYANCHKGFCIGFDKNKLQYFANNFGVNDKFILMDSIIYEEEYPSLNPLEMTKLEYAIKPLLVKSCSWKYENEIRLIYINGADEKIRLPKNIFFEVILGCKIPKEHREEILDEVHKNFDNLPVYQAELADDTFSLEFNKIK